MVSKCDLEARALVKDLCVGIVAAPVWSDASLSTKIPYLELDVLVRDCLYVESNSWNTTETSAH